MNTNLGLSQLRGLILDMDGTLIDSNAAHAHAFAEAMAVNGFPAVTFDRIRALIGMGGDQMIPAAIGIAGDSDVAHDIEADRKRIFQKRYLPHLKPTNGAVELLQRLQLEGIRLIVATSGRPEDARALLDQAGMRKLLPDMTTSADVESSKPAPDIVGAALSRLALPPESVLLLGDTPYDVQAGNRAGVGVIAVRCGGWDDSGLHGAAAIFDDPADLLIHLSEILRRK